MSRALYPPPPPKRYCVKVAPPALALQTLRPTDTGVYNLHGYGPMAALALELAA